MSSPMYDIPEHFPLPVNSRGQGPEEDLSKIVSWVCWCPDSLCPQFQVSGEAYREALTVLTQGKKLSPEKALKLVMIFIQLGWNKEHTNALDGAVRRAKALEAGDPNWMTA